MKKLIEKRNAIIEKMEELTNQANLETRALTEEEIASFDEMKEEVRTIDETLKREEEQRGIDIKNPVPDSKTEEEKEIRAFAQYIRGEVNFEERAEQNLGMGQNGAIVPKTIANRIISRVKEISPILNLATIYNVKGELSFPYYDETEQKIQMAYHDEFTKLSSTNATFKSKSLKGFIAGALSKISRSLVNNSDFDLVSYVVEKVAEAVADFLEKELLTGKVKMKGLVNAKQVVTSAAKGVITADEIIDVQMELPSKFNSDAVWIMTKGTLKAVRKLKDGDGNYLLNKDFTSEFGWSILGRPVYITDNMDDIATGSEVIFYGDMSGLVVKFVENMDIQVLREKYADEHAIGVVAWCEVDSDIIEEQKIAVLKMGE